ncbi:trypsin-like serine protease [Coemansia reversa NRRL 1564]|uniref:Trypsin-like serine protease n=1 Tax=Coemansia reversa (strain ATCC 12441 / NRRL 1564) TaxID=763665 RepID=A0A2G5B3E0_COERN|nr:trypsin-like serine protease [Coemansia reversa NRRL 1564]|eukprot:PIA13528.1 trypsin-like serine protease [Coemansia reversa NRRL 1564]
MARYSTKTTSTLLSLLSILTGTALADQRLIGGMAATEGMFPYVVHLFKNDRPYCGGVLIDKEWVLTAAHCVAKNNGDGTGAGSFTTSSAGDFKISYGSTDGTIGNYVNVDSITVSPDFDPIWYKSDIALLKIKSNNDLVSKTQTVVISTADIGTGQTLVTAGWGQITNDNTAQAGTLMYAGLTTADDATCKSGAPEYDSQNGLYVCTSYSTAPGIGTCFGDSGGPLLINTGSGYMLLGLVSFDVNIKDSTNTRCAQDGNVSFFTRVSTYMSFITSTTHISKSALVGPGSASTHSNSDSSADDEKSNTSKDGDDGDSKNKDNSSKDDSTSSEKESDKNNESTGKTEEEKESEKSDGKGKEAGDKVNNDNADEENADTTDDDSSAPKLLATGAAPLVANLAATLLAALF